MRAGENTLFSRIHIRHRRRTTNHVKGVDELNGFVITVRQNKITPGCSEEFAKYGFPVYSKYFVIGTVVSRRMYNRCLIVNDYIRNDCIKRKSNE